jgi:hypothetical protein
MRRLLGSEGKAAIILIFESVIAFYDERRSPIL